MSDEKIALERKSFEEIEGQPDLCGPEEFAAFFNRYRANIFGSPKYEHLIDDDVKFLISLAYYASTIAEEGRYPKFRFFHYPFNQSYDKNRTMVLFDPPIELKSVKDIHRLIPAVSSLDYALKVTKVDSEFCCDAIILVNDAELITELGTSDFSNFAGLTGISIRVDGPGDITVTQNGDRAQTFRLSGGRAVLKVQLNRLDEFNELVDRISKNLVATYLTAEKEKSSNSGFDSSAEYSIEKIVKFFWGSLLQKTSQARHGGAFILIPEIIKADELRSKYNIKLKYKIKDLNLGKIIADFFRWSKDILRIEMTVEFYKEEELYKDFNSRAWQYMKGYFLSSIQAIANLANVDGCVVLDAGMNVLGFGGEILGSDVQFNDSSNPADIRFFNRPTPITEDEMKNYGTRHRSAARLCNTHPYTFAFIISQDGDLRLFTSDDEGNVFFYKEIAALSGPLESI